MIKRFHKAFSIAAVCFIAFSGGLRAAAGTVTYEDTAKTFIFAPGSNYAPTDLFENMKDAMPGDFLTEQIVIHNKASNHVKIKLYMKSTGAAEGSEEFLSQMRLRVSQQGDSNLFDAPAAQAAQLSDWVYLGTVYSGGEIKLDVSLEVPLEMGDDFQNAAGSLEWQFKAEELPVSPEDPKPPHTGDFFQLPLFGGIFFGSLIFLIILIIRRKKHHS